MPKYVGITWTDAALWYVVEPIVRQGAEWVGDSENWWFLAGIATNAIRMLFTILNVKLSKRENILGLLSFYYCVCSVVVMQFEYECMWTHAADAWRKRCLAPDYIAGQGSQLQERRPAEGRRGDSALIGETCDRAKITFAPLKQCKVSATSKMHLHWWDQNHGSPLN